MLLNWLLPTRWYLLIFLPIWLAWGHSSSGIHDTFPSLEQTQQRSFPVTWLFLINNSGCLNTRQSLPLMITASNHRDCVCVCLSSHRLHCPSEYFNFHTQYILLQNYYSFLDFHNYTFSTNCGTVVFIFFFIAFQVSCTIHSHKIITFLVYTFIV